MKYTEKIANNLNELLEKNYDAEKGYKEAESNVDNVALKTFFKEQATLRNNFGNKLKEEIKSFWSNLR